MREFLLRGKGTVPFMYYYQSGAIGKAIHAKIESAKQSVRSGNRSEVTKPFGEVLKNYLGQTESKTKTVSSVSKNGSASGSALLYAMLNEDSEPAASAVLDTLGLGSSSSGISVSLRSAANDLSESAQALRVAEKSDPAASAEAFARFTSDYNLLLAKLGASSGTSGYFYRTALSAYANENGLDGTGLSVGKSGALTATGGAVDAGRLDAFLSGISSVARNISADTSSLSSSDLLGDLGTNYGTLLGLMS